MFCDVIYKCLSIIFSKNTAIMHTLKNFRSEFCDKCFENMCCLISVMRKNMNVNISWDMYACGMQYKNTVGSLDGRIIYSYSVSTHGSRRKVRQYTPTLLSLLPKALKWVSLDHLSEAVILMNQLKPYKITPKKKSNATYNWNIK